MKTKTEIIQQGFDNLLAIQKEQLEWREEFNSKLDEISKKIDIVIEEMKGKLYE